MLNKKDTVLIAAPAGSLRSAMKALLESMPSIGSVILADEPAAILEASSAAAPKAILLAGIENDLKHISIVSLRKAAPHACIICLLDDLPKAPAEALSADIVLQQGTPAEELVAVVEQCLCK